MANFFANYPGGSAGGGGGGGGSVLWGNETPAGLINNANVTFTVTGPIADANTFELYQDGLLLRPGGLDYTLVGLTITMVVAPNFGQTLYAYYRKT